MRNLDLLEQQRPHPLVGWVEVARKALFDDVASMVANQRHEHMVRDVAFLGYMWRDVVEHGMNGVISSGFV